MADGKLIFDVEFAIGDFKEALKTIEKTTKIGMDKTAKETERGFKKTNEEIKKSSRETQKEMDNFRSSELKKEKALAKEKEKLIKEELKRQQKVKKEILGHIGNIATSMISAFSVKNAVSSALQVGTAFENGLAKVSTMVDTNTVDMKKWGNELLEISNQTGISVEEITESTYQALSASVKQEDINKLLLSSSKLAVAGYSDMNTVIDATTSIINAYNMTGEDTDRIHKILIQTQNKGKTTVAELGATLSNVIPTAVQMGVNLESVGASLSVLTASGIPTTQSTTKLNALFTAFAKSGTETSKALNETYKGTKLAGKSFQDLLKAKPLNEILRDMSKYAEKNGKNFAEFFTSVEASAAASVLATTGFDMFTDSLKAMGTEADVVGEGFEKNQTTTQRWQKATNTLRNEMMTLFEMLLPAISSFVENSSKLINFFTNLNPLIKESIIIFGLIAGVLGTIIPLLFSLATAGAIASTALLPIIGTAVAIGVAIGAVIVVVRGMIRGFTDADSKLGAFARGSINLAIGSVNLLINGINALIKTINLIPGVNVPLIPKLEYAKASYSSKTEKQGIGKEGQNVLSAVGLNISSPRKGLIGPAKKNEYDNAPYSVKNNTGYGIIPKMARGGTVDGGSLFIAGESGRELLMTDRGKTTVIPLNANNSFGGNSINLTFNVSGGNIDERRLSDMVLTKLSRSLRT